jgi:short subunit dehydrogenase-like uncharacterized protein
MIPFLSKSELSTENNKTMKNKKVLIYGAYGFTGEIISNLSKKSPFKTTLAGRDRHKINSLATDIGLPFLVFDLNNQSVIRKMIRGFDLVIHAAGPYKYTAIPMVEACIAENVHYIDITGEWQIFEQIARYHEQAISAGIILLPGAGFDVVPSDCLATYAKSLMPNATSLTLAFQGGGNASRGTTLTALEYANEGCIVRKNGELKPSTMGEKISIDFGEGPRDCIAIPWGDVVTAWHSTGIPNIKVYMSASPKMQKNMKLAQKWSGIIKGPIKWFAQWLVKKNIKGPKEDLRETGKSYLYALVKNEKGDFKEYRLVTKEAYTLTAETALLAAKTILEGDIQVGFNTPATAFGPEFILKITGSKFY